MMISYTGKLSRLRPVRSSDKEHSVTWRNDPGLREYVHGHRFPVTEEMEDQWYGAVLKNRDKTMAVFAVEDITDNSLVGFIQLNRIDWIARTCYLGIIIGEKNKQGKGIGTDALHLLLTYAFEGLNLRKACVEVIGFNEKAKGLFGKFGFREEGKLREQVYLENRYYDLYLMGILNRDYYKKYGKT